MTFVGHLLTYRGSKFERDNSSLVVWAWDFGRIVPEISKNRISLICRSFETSETARPKKQRKNPEDERAATPLPEPQTAQL